MSYYINQIIYPKINKQETTINQTDINEIKYNENIKCNDTCSYEYNIDEKNFNNLVDKNYKNIDKDFINKIITIFNNEIKNNIINLIDDDKKKDILRTINTINGFSDYYNLYSNKDKYKNTLKESICDINKTYNNKIIFSYIISKILCNIKKCINTNEFEIIKNYILSNIKEIFDQCKK